MNPGEIKEAVNDRYARIAHGDGSFCPSTTRGPYDASELAEVPAGAGACRSVATPLSPGRD